MKTQQTTNRIHQTCLECGDVFETTETRTAAPEIFDGAVILGAAEHYCPACVEELND